FASPKIGFRCVKESGTPAGDQGGFALSASGDVPSYAPASDAEFRQFAAHYEYAKTPLGAKVVETIESDAWTREKITYRGANGKTVMAFLYLPKGAKRPLQVIHFAPASDIVDGQRPLTHELEEFLAPHIRAGRAAFGVILEGYLERPFPTGWSPPAPESIEFVDDSVARVTDVRRGLDYLGTRPDIDMTRIAFFAPSAGSSFGVILTAVEPRYDAVFFIGGGLRASSAHRFHPAANRINFAPHVRTPILMMHGRWDEVHPLKTNAEPLFKLLPEPKKLVVYDGGHMAPQSILVPAVKTWLDGVLGAVR
ncbi:MAG TPA: hypothetical protein VN181_11750, partial [Thermoanaerobaculia bacterium]|nr:hypothetical protein [Thermoanaerobaculia bacterium]